MPVETIEPVPEVRFTDRSEGGLCTLGEAIAELLHSDDTLHSKETQHILVCAADGRPQPKLSSVVSPRWAS